MTRWISDAQKIVHNCPGWDIPSAPLPLLLLLSSLLLISLQDQVQLNLRLHARASRFYSPVGVLHPVTVYKREVIVSELQPHLTNMFSSVFPNLIIFKPFFQCLLGLHPSQSMPLQPYRIHICSLKLKEIQNPACHCDGL